MNEAQKEYIEKVFTEVVYLMSEMGYDKGDIDTIYESALRSWKAKD